MVDISDAAVESARQGDPEAFRAVVMAFQRPIFQTVFRLVGGRFPAEVEDITQDIFLKIYRALPRFDAARGVKFSTWVYTFVKNHCFDVLKKRRIQTVHLDGVRSDDDDAGRHELEGRGLAPPQDAEQSEVGRRIQEAVGKLPEDQRIVFILREYQGLDYREIGQIAGCNEGTVKSRLYRAKEALRNSLRRYVQQ